MAAALVGRPGATTPLPDKAEAQAEAEEELLRRLVELNAQRAAEEARGLVRWLRPDYQNAQSRAEKPQAPSAITEANGGRRYAFPPYSVPGAASDVVPGAQSDTPAEADATPTTAAPAGKLAWPKHMREQVAAVRGALARHSLPLEAIAGQFKRSPKAAVLAVLEALEELGMVASADGVYRLQG